MVNDTRAEYDHLQTLSDEALCALVKQGSRDAEEILVGRYHRLVRSCARPYFLAGGDSEDLLQEGMFGLIKAIREYEPGHEASLCTFAETCIRRRLYSVLRAAASGKHSPLNQAVPLESDKGNIRLLIFPDIRYIPSVTVLRRVFIQADVNLSEWTIFH